MIIYCSIVQFLSMNLMSWCVSYIASYDASRCNRTYCINGPKELATVSHVYVVDDTVLKKNLVLLSHASRLFRVAFLGYAEHDSIVHRTPRFLLKDENCYSLAYATGNGYTDVVDFLVLYRYLSLTFYRLMISYTLSYTASFVLFNETRNLAEVLGK